MEIVVQLDLDENDLLRKHNRLTKNGRKHKGDMKWQETFQKTTEATGSDKK